MRSNLIVMLTILFLSGLFLSEATGQLFFENQLKSALYHGDVEEVNSLIADLPDINARDGGGRAFFNWAVLHGHQNIVELFVKEGVNINVTDRDGKTPLHLASENGHENLVTYLISHGAHVNAFDIDGRTPLYFARENGFEEAVKTLIASGADTSYLRIAKLPAYEDFIEALVLVDSNSIAIDRNGQTIAILESDPGNYFSASVKYDHLNGLIYFIDCSPLQKNRWNYRSMVWNYKTGKQWLIEEGESYYGEGYLSPLVFHYDPDKKSGIIQNSGWEHSYVTIFSPFRQHLVPRRIDARIHADMVSCLGFISDIQILLMASTIENYKRYYIYSIESESVNEISPDSLVQYKEELLLSGFNPEVRDFRPPNDFVQTSIPVWNLDGSALIYTQSNPPDTSNVLFLFDYQNKIRNQISHNHLAYAVIWKNDKEQPLRNSASSAPLR